MVSISISNGVTVSHVHYIETVAGFPSNLQGFITGSSCRADKI